jgi:hypothetical protein
MQTEQKKSWLAFSVLGLILLLGAGLRLFDLNRWGLNHPEAYVPGIRLPEDLVEFPLPRLTLAKTISGCIRAEPSHLLYYILMFGWTKVLGTDLIIMRLPSVFFGVASVYLLYVLGKCELSKATGLTAAAMLAANGHQILWSQTARGYMLACFFGLLSSVLLLRLLHGGSRPKALLWLYIASSLAGMATEFFYWPIFVTQVLWVAVRYAKDAVAPAPLRWQLLTFLLATPLIALVAHQSRLPSHTTGQALPFLGQFLQFGFLVEPDFLVPLGPLTLAAGVVLPLAAVFLLAVGLVSKGKPVEPETAPLPGPVTWHWAVAALLGLGFISGLGGCSYLWGGKRTGAIMATALVPLCVPFLDALLCRWWPRLQASAVGAGMRAISRSLTLGALLAVVPIAMILSASTIIPLYASRGALVYTPYLDLIAAQGLVCVVRRDLRWLVLGLVVALAHPLSIAYVRHRPVVKRDYRALSEALAGRVRPTDLIFVRGNHWQTTPLFYYLKAEHYHFVGKDYRREVMCRPNERIWAVAWEDGYMAPDMVDALRAYRPGESIEVHGARAVLYEKPAQHPNLATSPANDGDRASQP